MCLRCIKRIILKLSGEALAGDKAGVMYDDDTIFSVVEQIKEILDMGTQVALVIGGETFGGEEALMKIWTG